MPSCNWFDPTQDYACQPGPNTQIGYGCAVGCNPCYDDPQSFMGSVGTTASGRRYLYPAALLSRLKDDPYDLLESRDGRGRYHFLQTDDPWWMPRIHHAFLAMCFGQSGLERFDLDICACETPECDNAGEWRYLGGLYPTCHVFGGWGWPPAPITCFGRAVGYVPELLGFTGEYVGLGDTARAEWCTSNVGALCWGHIEDPPDRCDHWPMNQYPLYNPWHGIWDFARVVRFEPRFVEHSGEPFCDDKAVALKNAALAYIGTHLSSLTGGHGHGIDQVESIRRYASPGQNCNSQLTTWSSGWTASSMDEMPVVRTLDASALRYSKIPVMVEYVLASVALYLSYVPHRVKNVDPLNPPDGNDPQYELIYPTYPIANVLVDAHMALRVTMEGEVGQFVRVWRAEDDPDRVVTLSVHNDEILMRPRVEPEGVDELVLADADGAIEHIPMRVEWRGHLGFLSDPVATDRFSYGYHGQVPQTAEYHCCAVAAGHNPLIVPARQSHVDNAVGDRKRIWGGDVEFRFPYHVDEGGPCPNFGSSVEGR